MISHHRIPGIVRGRAISRVGISASSLLWRWKFACIPIPSEIIHAVRRISRFDRSLRIGGRCGDGSLGMQFSSTPAYAVGAYGGRTAIEWWGRYILMDPHDLSVG
jgi:membrane protein DedA with SNARE-associated domain